LTSPKRRTAHCPNGAAFSEAALLQNPENQTHAGIPYPEAFESHYPVGTKPRLAFELLLHTAQRRADVIRLGPQHVRGGVISIRQQKTGKTLAIPVSPALAAALDGTPSKHLTFLVTEDGQPFEAMAFTKWFRRCCDAAGLSGYSAHGLRKSACRRLAEAGCSANEIAAISGHASLREVERYTRAVDQARTATSGG